MAKTRRTQARDRAAHPRHRHRRIRIAAGRADLRRADVHARDRRRRILDSARRDDRGHPRDQARAAGRADLARRLQRSLWPASRRRAPRSTRSCCIIASRPGSTCAIVHAKDITPYAEIDAPSANCATISCSIAGPDALQRVIEHFEAPAARASRAAAQDDDAERAGRSSASTTRFCAAARTASKPRSTRR